MNIEYYILDPAGNITALVTNAVSHKEYKPIADRIMSINKSVEQVGFVTFGKNDIKLNMAGDEFCGNAVMSAAALYYYLSGKSGEYKTVVTVLPLGTSVNVTVKNNGADYQCQAVFDNPKDADKCKFSAGGKDYEFDIFSFDGISHIVADDTLSVTSAKKIIKKLAVEISTPALGIMIYDEKSSDLKPLVYVPASDTLFLENSCASGSCAVAYAKAEVGVRTAMTEPGGVIETQKCADGIRLYTTVKVSKLCFEEM